MRLKINRFFGIISLWLIMAVAAFWIYKVQKSTVQEQVNWPTNPIQQQEEVAEVELKATPPESLERLDAVQPITLRQADIHLQSQPNVAKSEGAPPGTTDAGPPAKIPAGNYNYAGVSIKNTSGNIIPSLWDGNPLETGQNEMIVVENLGRPLGVDFRPQPVTAMTQQGLESEELKILEQKRLKRKASFAKSLENSDVRKSLYKSRN